MDFEQTIINDLIDSAGQIIETFIEDNPMIYIQPSAHDDITNNTISLLNIMFSHLSHIKLHIEHAVDVAVSIFYRHVIPPRSFSNTFIRKIPDINKIQSKIEFIKNIPQPPQEPTNGISLDIVVLLPAMLGKLLSLMLPRANLFMKNVFLLTLINSLINL